jgi:hypothetical protein
MFVRELSLDLRLSKNGYFINGLKAAATLNMFSSVAVTFMLENFLVFMMSFPLLSIPSLYLKDKADLISVLFTAISRHLLLCYLGYIHKYAVRGGIIGWGFIFLGFLIFYWWNVEFDLYKLMLCFTKISLCII